MGWKIVRDNDAEYVPTLGVSGQWRPSADPIGGLTKKLFEEAAEFAEARDPAELYDLLDVVKELIFRLGTVGDAAAHIDKVAERGRFSKAIEWSPVP
jgi:predicted house-cleaning noncanonical NTP pyrophosphatase (MazG superfamily)